MPSNDADVYDAFFKIINTVIHDRYIASKTATTFCNTLLRHKNVRSDGDVNNDTSTHVKKQREQYEQLLRLQDVIARIGLKKSTIYAKIQQGTFPRPVKIGRATVWRASELEAWIATH